MKSQKIKSPPPSLLFQHLVESIKDYAIFTTDLKGRVTSWNAGAERLIGFSAKEAIGKNADALFIPEDRQRHEPQMELDRAKNEGRSPNERWHLKKDGSRFWGSGVVTPLMNHRRQQIGYVKIMRDLTDRKRMEDQLARKSDELEQFCHVVAHDLQAPIRKMCNFADLVQMRAGNKLDPSAQQFLDRMTKSGQRMIALIGDLLRFAKTVDPEGQFEPVDLHDVVGTVLSDLEVVIMEKEAKVEVSGLPVIRAHAPQMYQLFLNLVSNALKFSKKGVKPHVKITAVQKKAYAEITVSDNGIGFDPTHVEQLFKPFVRLHSYEQYEGSGIGLARCKKIVDFHAGTLTATGQPGKGATFIVTLPTLQR